MMMVMMEGGGGLSHLEFFLIFPHTPTLEQKHYDARIAFLFCSLVVELKNICLLLSLTLSCPGSHLSAALSLSLIVLEGIFPFNMGWHKHMPHVLSFHASEVLATQLLLIVLASLK